MKCPRCLYGVLIPLSTQNAPHFCNLCGKISLPIERKNKEIWQGEDGIYYNNNGVLQVFHTSNIELVKEEIVRDENKKSWKFWK